MSTRTRSPNDQPAHRGRLGSAHRAGKRHYGTHIFLTVDGARCG